MIALLKYWKLGVVGAAIAVAACSSARLAGARSDAQAYRDSLITERAAAAATIASQRKYLLVMDSMLKARTQYALLVEAELDSALSDVARLLGAQKEQKPDTVWLPKLQLKELVLSCTTCRTQLAALRQEADRFRVVASLPASIPPAVVTGTAPPRSCVAPTAAGGVVGALLGAIGGSIVERHRRRP